MMQIFSWLKEHIRKKEQWLIPALIGILLLVIAMPSEKTVSSDKSDIEEEKEVKFDDTYTENLESRLEKILSQIQGVGNAKVMITLAASTEKIVEKDIEIRNASSESDTENSVSNDRTEQSVYSNFSEGDLPYVKQELSPVIEGVLVVADGGDNAVVKQNITEAIQALFDIDTHKIRVMKHN